MQRANVIRWLVVALAIGVSCLWYAIDVSRDRTTVASEQLVPLSALPSDTRFDERVGRLSSDLSPPPTELSAAQRASAAPSLPDALLSSAPGKLAVTASDPSALGPLRWFDVRVANEARFAQRRSVEDEREVELPLTPGAYGVCVSSPGYEPAEIPSVDVTSGETVRLASIVLAPGRGRIRVQVVGAPDADRKLTVELRGEGRHPCERCGVRVDATGAFELNEQVQGQEVDAREIVESALRSPWTRIHSCSACGYARDLSRAFLRSGESFTFANLASGAYALRLIDRDNQTIGVPRQITLDVGETASISFDAHATRAVEVELVDVDGRSLTAEWSRRIATVKQSGVETVEAVESTSDAFELTFADAEREVAHVTVLPPSLDGHVRVASLSFTGRRLRKGTAVILEPGRAIDRARRAADSLRPDLPEPEFARPITNCEIDEHGSVNVLPLPSTSLRLRVTSSCVSGEATVPASRDTVRVRVWLHAR